MDGQRDRYPQIVGVNPNYETSSECCVTVADRRAHLRTLLLDGVTDVFLEIWQSA